ncbi:hypothetical protein RFI_32301 [Reticulomyxa filosa]|uniref:Uncharacterized protein n=1 Tax=Reticulomyxa filosa TaxID=46433 RepID=X6LT34_RETFI|nr:hypothetical protein RFI_32301 [Reticulomyxa filosa]|eukprot:ETO05093.1 hypothetical protein RFI_32301 [Reticulomyxa filosa]
MIPTTPEMDVFVGDKKKWADGCKIVVKYEPKDGFAFFRSAKQFAHEIGKTKIYDKFWLKCIKLSEDHTTVAQNVFFVEVIVRDGDQGAVITPQIISSGIHHVPLSLLHPWPTSTGSNAKTNVPMPPLSIDWERSTCSFGKIDSFFVENTTQSSSKLFIVVQNFLVFNASTCKHCYLGRVKMIISMVGFTYVYTFIFVHILIYKYIYIYICIIQKKNKTKGLPFTLGSDIYVSRLQSLKEIFSDKSKRNEYFSKCGGLFVLNCSTGALLPGKKKFIQIWHCALNTSIRTFTIALYHQPLGIGYQRQIIPLHIKPRIDALIDIISPHYKYVCLFVCFVHDDINETVELVLHNMSPLWCGLTLYNSFGQQLALHFAQNDSIGEDVMCMYRHERHRDEGKLHEDDEQLLGNALLHEWKMPHSDNHFGVMLPGANDQNNKHSFSAIVLPPKNTQKMFVKVNMIKHDSVRVPSPSDQDKDYLQMLHYTPGSITFWTHFLTNSKEFPILQSFNHCFFVNVC